MQHFLNSSYTFPLVKDPKLESLLLRYSNESVLPAKSKFLEYGDTLDGMYYVFSGRTKHYILGEDGAEKILYTLSAGWFFGETPLVLHEPTGLISETMEPSVLWKLPYSSYDRLLDESKLFRTSIMNCMSRKLLILRHEIENLVFNPCKQRIMQLLCSTANTASLQEGNWYDLYTHYTQYEISTIIGSARVTTSKLINELCNSGYIRILNRKIQVSKEAYEVVAEDDELL
ncbi:Crp/Fnr family transcriptional regulator [Sphaerochaeta sp. PS]|uniref:Crp/Fnr family transcriptional regulator n=1 Tax=Sphaerochaeta sp. PS TaxID=3076336 RepID=UPI0028A50227|nr:Crp/Fnr family transcriptional regulator [Sphaerochaeta sp. PS]MDT4762849.1 Crp/Fnr family transcriptional regulator [Sphaerochaeta sp. PS]